MIDFEDIEIIGESVIIFFILFLFLSIPIIFVSNTVEKMNCELMIKNGHEAHLEKQIFFIKKCYVEGVSYHKYIKAEVKE